MADENIERLLNQSARARMREEAEKVRKGYEMLSQRYRVKYGDERGALLEVASRIGDDPEAHESYDYAHNALKVAMRNMELTDASLIRASMDLLQQSYESAMVSYTEGRDSKE